MLWFEQIWIFSHFTCIFLHFFFRRGSPLYAHLWLFDGPNSNKWTFTVIRGQAGQLPKRHSNHWCVMTEVQTSTYVFRKLRWNLSWYYTECFAICYHHILQSLDICDFKGIYLYSLFCGCPKAIEGCRKKPWFFSLWVINSCFFSTKAKWLFT